MTDTMDWTDLAEAAVPRDRWGRPLITPPGGGKPKAYTRVTTFAGSVEDMYGLGQWQQRMVALGLAKRSDLLLSVSAHAEDKDELNKIVDSAREAAAASAAATTGTALHKLAERYDRGQLALTDMPESNIADMRAYAATMRAFTIHGIEEFVVVDDIQCAGTFDRIVEYDGQRYVADIKTGSIEYGVGKMAVQLALYARGQLYVPGETERRDTDVSRAAGIIVHLPAGQGRCDLYWIDLRAGWEAAELCEKVRSWRKRKGLLAAAKFGVEVLAPESKSAPRQASAIMDSILGSKPVEDHPPQCDCGRPECVALSLTAEADAIEVLNQTFTTTEVPLSQLIREAPDAAALEALWAENREAWTPEHTRLASDRKKHFHHQILRDATDKARARLEAHA